MSASENKRARDATSTRETILNAAEAVFAEHGFDGARIDVIAAKSSYNKSLIFQYFGDKLGLYGEVIRRADAQTRGLQAQAFASLLEEDVLINSERVRDLFETWLNDYFDYLVEHPQITRIYLWELAEGWQTLSKILDQHDYQDVDEFTLLLRKLQQMGVLRSDRDPTMQIIMAVFLCPFLLGLIPMYQTLQPDTDFSSRDALAREREYAVDFVLRTLIVDPSGQNRESNL